MLGIALELRTQCAGCGQPLPINAFAERITCAGCNRETAITAERWKLLLEDALGELHELDQDEGKNQTIMTGGATFALQFGNQQPRCSACKNPVPVEAAAFADRGWTVCPHCGKRMSIRRAPAPMAALGMSLLVGEDFAQVPGAGGAVTPGGAQKAAAPVVLYCPNCKGALSVDGSNRMVKCQYCSTDVYLPDELWQRLHPVAQVSRWYGWLADVDIAARKLAQFRWSSIADAVIDASNNIYCAGEDGSESFGDKFIVWCMGPDLVPRWIREGLDYSDSDARLALDPRGRLLLWQSGKHSLTVLSCADGSTLGKLGGKEPEGATEHHLDLDDAKQLCVDVDGTILVLIGERLCRFTEDGKAAATWPPRSGLFGKKAEKLHPLYGPGHSLIRFEGADVEVVGNHPAGLDDYSKMHVGWDGRLFAEYSEWVAAFDREGNRLYRMKLPVDDDRGHRIGSDAAGNLYVLTRKRGDPDLRQLVRVAPDGSRADVIANDHRAGGVLGDEERMVVAAGGQIVLLAYGKAARMLGPDGSLLYISEHSKEEDAEELEEIAKKA